MKRRNLKRPNTEFMKEDIPNGSGSRSSSSSMSRGSTGLSITEVTDQVSPDSNREMKSKFIKSLNESENLKDELFPSPKSKHNETHTNVQKRHFKRKLALNSINKGGEVEKEKSSKRMKISRGIKKSRNGEDYQTIGSRRFMKDTENEEFKTEHNYEEFKAGEIEIVPVYLDASVSSVEVSEDEQEENGITRCDWCKKKFQEKDWGKLKRHKKLFHGTPCASCNLMFVDESDLVKHTSEYHSKRKNYVYECRKCLKKTQSLKSNLKHEELEHPYQCQLCIVEKVMFPFSFTNKKGLQIHKQQKHKRQIRETDEIDLSKEDASSEGDESKDSLESVQIVAVKPKIIKERKDETGSKRKASMKSNLESGKPKEKGGDKKNPESKLGKSETPISDKKVDQLPEDFSNFIKNESLTEENQFNDSIWAVDHGETRNEIKHDYSLFIINETLQEDQMSKKVAIANVPVKGEYKLDPRHFEKDDQVKNADKGRKKVENQNMSNDVKSSEEQNGKEEEFNINNVETEEKEVPVDREADLKADNILLKKENNIQDSEISTTCRNTPEKINEEYIVDDIDIGVNSNEAEENYNIHHIEEEGFQSNENINANKENEKNKWETPPKSSETSIQSSKTPEQGVQLEVVCRSNEVKKRLDLSLIKNDYSNSEKLLPKFIENISERIISPNIEKRKSNKKQFTIITKVNGKLQVTPSKLKKSDQEQYKNLGKRAEKISSENKTVFDSNDGPIQMNQKVDGVSKLFSKCKRSIPIQDVKKNAKSCLSIDHNVPKRLKIVSSDPEENISIDKAVSSGHKEKITPDETICNTDLADLSQIASNLADNTNSKMENTTENVISFSSPPKDNIEDLKTKCLPAKIGQEHNRGCVKSFSEKNSKERPIVSDVKSTIQENFQNKIDEKLSDCNNGENLDTDPQSNQEKLVMNSKSPESYNIVANVTPHRSKMPKAFDGLSLISATYLNISSDTDSPVAPHFPEVLVSESPIGQPIGSSSPLQVKPESVPLKIGKVEGIQAFKDQRKSREVWKVGKRKTNSDSERINPTHDIALPLNEEPLQELVSDNPDETQQNDCDDNESLDSVDELGLDVTESPEKKKETYDIGHFDDGNSVNFDMEERFARCGKKPQGYTSPVIEPEKVKPLQLERYEGLASIEDLMGSDDDDDYVPENPDVKVDKHCKPEKHTIHRASENAADRLKDKMKNKRFSVDHTCLYCDRTFDRVSLLKNHMLFAHNISSEDSFVCDLCKHHFKQRCHLMDHVTISHNYKCKHCSLTFHSRGQMELHFTDAHPDGHLDQPDLDETGGLQEKLLECELCKEKLHWEEFLQHTELSHTVPCKLQLDPEFNNSPHLWFVSDNALAWHVHREHDGPEPDCLEKTTEARQDDLNFSSPVNIQVKKNFGRKLKEDKKEGINSLHSDLDKYARFSQDKQFESVTCCVCGLEFEEVDQFSKHSRILHPFDCSQGECQKRFTNKKNLSDHLTKDHSVSYLNMNGEDTIKLTATRSVANIEMVNSVEEWMRSRDVVAHLVRVMKGELKSRRHELFMDRKEREQSGPIRTSKLYVLSNPAFMGNGTGERDSEIIHYLIEDVFKFHFPESDTRLQEIGLNSGFIYATTVLFPEMFLNQHQVRNRLSREEAEKAFMEIEVTNEEREGLEQEIREGVVSQDEETSDEDWIDDSADNDFENTIIVEDSD